LNGTTICRENKYDSSNTEKRIGSVLGLLVEVLVTFRSMVVVLVEVWIGVEVAVWVRVLALVGIAVEVWVGVLALVEVSVEVEVKVVVIKVLTNERRTYEKRNAMPHRGVLSDRGRLYP
jgi:hypothetical protein